MIIRMIGPMESVCIVGPSGIVAVALGHDGELKVREGALVPGLADDEDLVYVCHDTAPLSYMRKCYRRDVHLLSECEEPIGVILWSFVGGANVAYTHSTLAGIKYAGREKFVRLHVGLAIVAVIMVFLSLWRM